MSRWVEANATSFGRVAIRFNAPCREDQELWMLSLVSKGRAIPSSRGIDSSRAIENVPDRCVFIVGILFLTVVLYVVFLLKYIRSHVKCSFGCPVVRSFACNVRHGAQCSYQSIDSYMYVRTVLTPTNKQTKPGSDKTNAHQLRIYSRTPTH